MKTNYILITQKTGYLKTLKHKLVKMLKAQGKGKKNGELRHRVSPKYHENYGLVRTRPCKNLAHAQQIIEYTTLSGKYIDANGVAHAVAAKHPPIKHHPDFLNLIEWEMQNSKLATIMPSKKTKKQNRHKVQRFIYKRGYAIINDKLIKKIK